jgi:cell division FtsZ-interacting protein ZapD
MYGGARSEMIKIFKRAALRSLQASIEKLNPTGKKTSQKPCVNPSYLSSLIKVVSEKSIIATAPKIMDMMKVVVARIVGPKGRCPVDE